MKLWQFGSIKFFLQRYRMEYIHTGYRAAAEERRRREW